MLVFSSVIKMGWVGQMQMHPPKRNTIKHTSRGSIRSTTKCEVIKITHTKHISHTVISYSCIIHVLIHSYSLENVFVYQYKQTYLLYTCNVVPGPTTSRALSRR